MNKESSTFEKIKYQKMKKILLLVAALAIVSCESEPKIDYAILAGKIENPKQDKIVVSAGDFKQEISVDKDGSFVDTLSVDAGFYTATYGRNRATLFLSPGDSLHLTTNALQFNNLAYKGKGAAENTYLVEKAVEDRKMNFQQVYTNEEAAFLETIKEKKAKAVDALKKAKDLNPAFIALEEENINYEYLVNLLRYPSYHPYFTKKQDFKVSEGFLNPLKELDFDNAEDFKNFEAYQQIVSQHYFEKFYTDSTKTEALTLIKDLKSQNIKNALAEELVYALSPSSKDLDLIYTTIKEISTDEELVKEATKKYEKVQNLVAGKDSPTFDYENHKGGTTSLADLKGKYVYIDVWATWCGPCIGEIPSLQKVEEQYHDKNIAFVSISIDQKNAYDTWKKMVVEKELGGIQLMADNAWQSKFVTDYAIEGIPRFILIGPDGKIVNADAPRPSNPKLIALFDELKI